MTTIDLPFPPSLNRIWRYSRANGKPYIDARYQTWRRVADNLYLANGKNWSPVKGNFKATITLSTKRRRSNADCDNRGKAVLDWLQRVGLIENDSLCDGVSIAWGVAPEGCRVRLRAS